VLFEGMLILGGGGFLEGLEEFGVGGYEDEGGCEEGAGGIECDAMVRISYNHPENDGSSDIPP